MSTDLKNFMDTSDDGIKQFDSAICELISSKYILAEKRITNLLQIIAGNRKLYEMFAEILQDYDFVLAFSRVALAENGIVFGGNREKNVALIFCLLIEIDSGNRNFKEFLHKYFFDGEGANYEYDKFAKNVLTYFKKNVEILFAESQGKYVENNAAEKYFLVSDDKRFDRGLVERVSSYVRDLITIIAREKVDIDDKDDLLSACEAMSYIIATSNVSLIKVAAIAIKNTVKVLNVSKICHNSCTTLINILEENHLLV